MKTFATWWGLLSKVPYMEKQEVARLAWNACAAEYEKALAECQANNKRLMRFVKECTEYKIGNPAYEALRAVDDSAIRTLLAEERKKALLEAAELAYNAEFGLFDACQRLRRMANEQPSTLPTLQDDLEGRN